MGGVGVRVGVRVGRRVGEAIGSRVRVALGTGLVVGGALIASGVRAGSVGGELDFIRWCEERSRCILLNHHGAGGDQSFLARLDGEGNNGGNVVHRVRGRDRRVGQVGTTHPKQD